MSVTAKASGKRHGTGPAAPPGHKTTSRPSRQRTVAIWVAVDGVAPLLLFLAFRSGRNVTSTADGGYAVGQPGVGAVAPALARGPRAGRRSASPTTAESAYCSTSKKG